MLNVCWRGWWLLTYELKIIAYLDLKGHEWEVENAGLQSRCNHLQASLDLQIGSHSHKVWWYMYFCLGWYCCLPLYG